MVETGSSIAWSLDASPIPLADPITLGADQRVVTEHRHGPMLVLAGPGTGKTSTIVEAVAARMADPDEPLRGESILVLTFGRRAAIEVRDRIMRRVGADPQLARAGLPTVATFHSYAFRLIAEAAVADGDNPPRLLSGAEEDVRIRELLLGGIADGTIDWPEDLRDATSTLGLANEVRAVLARARVLGLSGAELRRIGLGSDRPAWAAIGQLATQDEQVMVLENVCDYAELLHRAVLRLDDPAIRARVQSIRAIFVDEYQDTDPLQVQMLRRLVGPATSLVVVGDPDQAIYGFRGASVDAMLDFPEQFPQPDGRPAPVVTLQTTRRFGPVLRSAATRLLGDRPVTARGNGVLDSAELHRHRRPSTTSEFPGTLRVESFDSVGARAAWVADEIRRAHVRDLVPWDEMAVLVRGAAQLPALQRALVLADIPVSIPAEEIPLRAEPAVGILLSAATAAIRIERIDAELAATLLTGPLGGLDSRGLRRLGRVLRSAHRHEFAGQPVPESGELIARALREVDSQGPPIDPRGGPDVSAEWRALRRFQALLVTAHAQIQADAPAPEVLWTLWSGRIGPTGPFANQRAHGWPERLRTAALGGSRSAHHDLDAVMALFDTAERSEGRYAGAAGLRTVLAALQAQQIPAEPVVERGITSPGVRVLTAHRAKGLEWRRVWIAGAEEGTWPDIRPRGSILQAERLDARGLGPAASPVDLLAEERRLFYVALTRARECVVVTTLADPADGASHASRFLADLPVPIDPRTGRPRQPASLPGLLAELRGVAQDASRSAALREAAAARIARLAHALDDHGMQLLPAAHPDAWWGVQPITTGARAVRPPDQPINLSGSGLASLTTCGLQWFLDHEVRAQTRRPNAMAFGSVVHSVAEYVAKGEVPADLDAMDALLDRIWHELRFEARWQSQAERAQARAALERFLRYHDTVGRPLMGVEVPLDAMVEVPTPGPVSPTGESVTGVDRVHLRGHLDRIEQDPEGRPVAVDLKTTKHVPSVAEVAQHAQLGVYQVLMRQEYGSSGGAALVQLRVAAGKNKPEAKVQSQEALDDSSPTWVDRQLGAAAQIVRSEDFVARPGRHCELCAFTSLCPAQPDGQQVLP